VAGENPSRGARLAVRLLDLVERGNRESAS